MTQKLTFAQVNRPHAVYRLYDKDRTLLYIGCSHDPKRRLKKLREKWPWAKDVVDQVWEWYPSWSPAILAEGKAIWTEQPKYNQHLDGNR